MKKRYVVYENTIKEVFRIAEEKKDPLTNQIELYRHDFYHDMDVNQMRLQNNNSWQTRISMDLTMYNDDLEKAIENAVFEVMLSKSRENIEKKLFNRVMDSKISASIQIEEREHGMSRISKFIETDFDRKECGDNVEHIYDTAEMEKKLDDAKLGISFAPKDSKDFVYVDYIVVSIYDYRLNRMKEMIPKTIKKVINKNLKYCLKKGVSIVPDEYLDKGINGIKEWQEMKSSSNKNNSMEKRLMKQMMHEKKKFVADCISTATRLIAGANYNWRIPSLEVDGRYNQQRVRKLVSELLKDKNNQEIMSMSNEDIVSLCKEYWKKILKDAYDVVDQMKVEGQ